MKVKYALPACLFTLALVLPCAVSAKISGDIVKIGFLTDLSGVYSDGTGGVGAMRVAIADFGGTVRGKKIELVAADHMNRADIAVTRAREWIDTQGIDMLKGGVNSAANLALARLAQEKKKPFISVGAATARLTNEDCSPFTFLYAFDTVALARGTVAAVVNQEGKDWHFVTADYAFSASLEKDAAEAIKRNGGCVAGSAKHPMSASDFSSFLLQTQASKAQIMGLANVGGDTINAIKAAHEFGLNKSMKIAGLLIRETDIHSIGLKQAQGMYLTTGWY